MNSPTTQLRAKLDLTSSRLEGVRSTILEYQTSLAALEEKRHKLEMELAEVVYPVLTLPSEITSRIFVECLPAHGRVRPAPHTAPLSLTQTCRQWREIAIASCMLWRSVNLCLDGRSSDSALPRLRQWFARTKGQPLSLTIRSGTTETTPILAWIP
ncbi:hypothetical protein B0H11DRAFT_1886824 [Mycena galericulata]|nr:hypothetical protein B0H11DRAFT_1886824 [Mycena galericulata]